MRLTPTATRSPTLNDLPLMPAMKLNGFDKTWQTVRTLARSGSALTGDPWSLAALSNQPSRTLRADIIFTLIRDPAVAESIAA